MCRGVTYVREYVKNFNISKNDRELVIDWKQLDIDKGLVWDRMINGT